MQMQLSVHKTANITDDKINDGVSAGNAGSSEAIVPAAKRRPIVISFTGRIRQS